MGDREIDGGEDEEKRGEKWLTERERERERQRQRDREREGGGGKQREDIWETGR